MNSGGWVDPGRFEIILHVLAVKAHHQTLLEDPHTPNMIQLATVDDPQTTQRFIGSLRKVEFTREISHSLSVREFLTEAVRVVFGSQNSNCYRGSFLRANLRFEAITQTDHTIPFNFCHLHNTRPSLVSYRFLP